MVTPFGKAVKKLRIERGALLKDMADAIGVKPSYLSAVESGRKRITEALLNDAVSYFGNSDEARGLRRLVDCSQPDCQIRMQGHTDRQRMLVANFARKFSDLTPERMEKIESLLDEMGDDAPHARKG